MATIGLTPLPPEEAIDFFRAKGFAIGFDWRDVWQEEHRHAFTVAKVMDDDLLKDIRTAVDSAIAEGKTLAQFTDELEPILRRRGWWGRQDMLDPITNEIRTVQLGSPRRLKTIFETNLRTAYSAGRWSRIQRLKARFPYLRYSAVQDSRTRPQHLAWHNTILHVDHPWWKTHYPPNGWNCRCLVVQYSARQLERRGWKVSPDPATKTRPLLNNRTGEVTDVSEGIDLGWDYNVGVDRSGGLPPITPIKPPPRPVRPAAPPRTTAINPAPALDLDGAIEIGRQERLAILEGMDDGLSEIDWSVEFANRLRLAMETRGRNGRPAQNLSGSPDAKAEFEDATALLPPSWIEAQEEFGQVFVALIPPNGRAGAVPMAQQPMRAPPMFRGKQLARGDGAVTTRRGAEGTALHEFVHRLQAAIPALDGFFQALHRRRTAGDPLKPVNRLGELGREDSYLRKYTGREYDPDLVRQLSGLPPDQAALEVMTMALQMTLSEVHGQLLQRALVAHDPELIDLVLGVLFHFDP